MEAKAPKATITNGAAKWTRARAAARPDLRPVTIIQRRDHGFEKKPGNQRGCKACGRPKGWHGHYGYPPSMNFSNKGNQFTFYNTKLLWQEIFIDALERSGLPRGLDRVFVEGRVCFPTRARRDQGNFRYMIEKALGDALVLGGWLADDDWLHYECGRLAIVYSKGASWTELTLHPEWESSVEWELAPEEPFPGQLPLVA